VGEGGADSNVARMVSAESVADDVWNGASAIICRVFGRMVDEEVGEDRVALGPGCGKVSS
jgi:hypothetical protein